MYIQRLLIDRVRNLESTAIDELSLLNFFIGPNGAGKTSVLEAISIVAQGRSFRSSKIQTVINSAETDLSVFLQCKADTGETHKLGIQRDRKNNYLVRIDGESAATLAVLSEKLPVVVLDATAFDLLDGSPSIRRKFIDWGVFHVEHQFYETWRRYSKILKQRNQLLKMGISDYGQFEPWDTELVNLACQLEKYRVDFLSTYYPIFTQTLGMLDDELQNLKIYYKNGWQFERLEFQDLSERNTDQEALKLQLKASFEKDLKYQRTHLGAHKADIQLRTDKNDIKDIYSRGQKKTVVAALKLAQAKVLSSLQQKTAILLLDDLPSELDDNHLNRFIDFAHSEQYQCFITAVDDRIYKRCEQSDARMFHVEHGKIRPKLPE